MYQAITIPFVSVCGQGGLSRIRSNSVSRNNLKHKHGKKARGGGRGMQTAGGIACRSVEILLIPRARLRPATSFQDSCLSYQILCFFFWKKSIYPVGGGLYVGYVINAVSSPQALFQHPFVHPFPYKSAILLVIYLVLLLASCKFEFVLSGEKGYTLTSFHSPPPSHILFPEFL